MYKIYLSVVVLCVIQSVQACGRYRGGSGDLNGEVEKEVAEKEEGYVFHGENKTATFPYEHLKGNDTYCQSQCDNDISCNGFSINTSNSDCFISACDIPTTILSCFTCYFASKNPPLSNVVCPLNSTLNHTTTFTQPTTMAQFNTNMSHLTTTQRTPIEQSATVTQATNFEQSSTVTQRHSIEEATTESQQPPTEQATIVKQLSHIEQPTTVTEQPPIEQITTVTKHPPTEQVINEAQRLTNEQPASVTQQPPFEQPITVTLMPTNERPSTVTEQHPIERPSTVIQQPPMKQPSTFTQQSSIEQPTTVIHHHIKQPTTVTQRSTLEQSTTVTQKTIREWPTIEQSTYTTIRHRPYLLLLLPLLNNGLLMQDLPVSRARLMQIR